MRTWLVLELIRPVASCAGALPAGHRGCLRPEQSWSLYDLHVEVPLDGVGVPFDAVRVVVEGEDGAESLVSLLDWARASSRPLRCRACGADVLDAAGPAATWSTSARRARCQARRERLARLTQQLSCALASRRAVAST